MQLYTKHFGIMALLPGRTGGPLNDGLLLRMFIGRVHSSLYLRLQKKGHGMMWSSGEYGRLWSWSTRLFSVNALITTKETSND